MDASSVVVEAVLIATEKGIVVEISTHRSGETSLVFRRVKWIS